MDPQSSLDAFQMEPEASSSDAFNEFRPQIATSSAPVNECGSRYGLVGSPFWTLRTEQSASLRVRGWIFQPISLVSTPVSVAGGTDRHTTGCVSPRDPPDVTSCLPGDASPSPRCRLVQLAGRMCFPKAPWFWWEVLAGSGGRWVCL